MKQIHYILVLLGVSSVFFVLVASLLKTENPYFDLVFTILVTQLVMGKVVNIKK